VARRLGIIQQKFRTAFVNSPAFTKKPLEILGKEGKMYLLCSLRTKSNSLFSKSC